MKWPATMQLACAACGESFRVQTPEFLSLCAACPFCETSLASLAEKRLRLHAEYCRDIDLFFVGYELQTTEGIDISDSVVETAKTLDDLVQEVTYRLPVIDAEVRAVELVTETA
jgi:hypothetical protein